MDKVKIWTPNEVTKLFRITKTKTTLLRDEANKTIPEAIRVKRGKSSVRAWNKNDLPQIGKIHGLENLAFATPEEIEAAGGNPMKL